MISKLLLRLDMKLAVCRAANSVIGCTTLNYWLYIITAGGDFDFNATLGGNVYKVNNETGGNYCSGYAN